MNRVAPSSGSRQRTALNVLNEGQNNPNTRLQPSEASPVTRGASNQVSERTDLNSQTPPAQQQNNSETGPLARNGEQFQRRRINLNNFDTSTLPPEVQRSLIYRPYANLRGFGIIVKYFNTQNILLKLTNFTLLTSYLSCLIGLILLTYALYKDMDFSRCSYSLAFDCFSNLLNIYLQRKRSDTVGQKIHEYIPELCRVLALGFFYGYRIPTKRQSVFVWLTIFYFGSVIYRFTCTRYNKMKYLGEVTEIMLALTALLGMLKVYLNKDILWATVVSPLFYYSICLALLRTCLFLKATFFLFSKLCTCCEEKKKREWQIFLIDLLTSANELFFFTVMLFTLFFAGALDSPKDFDFEGRFKTCKTLWLAFTIFYGVRSFILYCALSYLSSDLIREVYKRRVLRNHFSKKSAMPPQVTVEKPSGFNRLLNLVQVTPGFYAEKGKENEGGAAGASPEDKMCTICFSADSDCIIFPCKHSGICKECSLDLLKKNPHCPFCRDVMEHICVVSTDESGALVIEEKMTRPKDMDIPEIV